ncbi:BCS1-like ATPase, putative [Talaromyces stipitatus ATCC 10500]|uniref:BCS1-like ATPase, putative n=1 Tax=Talaromyces stipitatus (strain ATCC 10500 / CBS 375.48 / QM 6759 / NRRL 1006) TaxID=441959 RepID=B8MRW2_TALSN|nr:BCS1-like ATPase, putative [Talaromyces stipitatus ATCC 10500]EED13296.1 BCS1-like ATPase, putative [Talaromyces stipitatus ATCC 10500]
MASPLQTCQNATITQTSPTPLSTLPVLENFFPGFSIISIFFSKYLHLDISAYLSLVFLLATVAATIRLRVENIIENIQSYFTSTIEVRMDDEVFNYLMYWVSRQGFSRKSTRAVASTKTRANSYYSDGEDDDDDSDDESDKDEKEFADASNDFDSYWSRRVNKDKIKPLRITPAEGIHWFWFKGYRIKLRREQVEKRTYGWGMPAEKLYVSCFGRNPDVLRQLLLEAQRMYVDRDGDKTIIYRAQRDGTTDYDWTRCMARPPRPLSTVVLDDAQKHAFISDIKEYLHPRTRRWYSNRGIPYRRGYMFYGPPGTGKSSLCFAAAGAMHLKIYLISLNSRTLNEESLASLFQTLPRRCIVLLEDVDAAGLANKRSDKPNNDPIPPIRPIKPEDDNDGPSTGDGPRPPPGDSTDTNKKDDDSNKGISLSALLNIIDGVASSEGRILVMTTNHIEKLDPALLRPGRVDLSIAFGYSDRDAIKNLFLAIYAPLDCEMPKSSSSAAVYGQKNTPSPSPRHSPAPSTSSTTKPASLFFETFTKDEIADLAEKFADAVPAGEFTPAEIQGHLLLHKKNPLDAIEEAEIWAQGLRERKKDRKEK